MYRPRSKREQRIRFFLTYTIVPVIIVTLATAVLFMIQGYRFSTQDNRVIQAGLVQFGSRPSGATITLNGEQLSSKTRARLNVAPGVHTIGMTRSGYVPWQKTVNVIPGSVLWLTYPQLIPEAVATSTLYEFDTVAASLVQPKERLYGVQPNPRVPSLITVKADDNNHERTTATVPSSRYDTRSSQQWRAVEWSESGRYVLFRTAGDKPVRWLMLDRSEPERSINLNQATDLNSIDNVSFDLEDDRWMYMLTNGALQRFDRNNETLSARLARDVVSQSQSTKGVVSYVSRDRQGVYSMAYLTRGADRPAVISMPAVTDPRDTVVTEHNQRQYIAVLSRGKLTIATTSLHSSDSGRELELSKVTSLPLPNTTSDLSLSPSGRFILARDGRTVHSFDLELQSLSQIKLSNKQSRLMWVSDYHVTDVNDGELFMQEFDGSNVTPVTTAASNAAVVVSSNSEALYTLVKTDTGYSFVRAQLVL